MKDFMERREIQVGETGSLSSETVDDPPSFEVEDRSSPSSTLK